MRFNKKFLACLVIAGGVIGFPDQIAGGEQDSNWKVIGRKLPWTMVAPGGWIGGSYSQIQQVRDTTPNPTIKTLLGQIWFTARQVDVYLVHTDVTNSKTLTEVTVDVLDKGFAETDFTDDMWRALATMDDSSKGATIKFLQSDTLKVGGRPAPRGLFEVTLASGASAYGVRCIVLVDANRSHMFSFKADRAKALARMKEFDEMLFSVRYQ